MAGVQVVLHEPDGGTEHRKNETRNLGLQSIIHRENTLAEMIVKKLSLNNISEFTGLPKEEFEKGIEFLKNMKYTTCNQISRVTRINRYQLKKIWKRGDR